MKNPRINEMENRQAVSGMYIVKSHTTAQTRRGSTYLAMVLKDRYGEIPAKLWDIPNGLDPDTIMDGWYICISGNVDEYNGNLQIIIDSLRLPTKDDIENIDVSDIVPCSPYQADEILEDIYCTMDNFQDQELKSFVWSIVAENERMLCVVPAAKSIHHAVVGGLLWHMKGMLDIGRAVAGFYPVNKDLLLSGIILHDIAKIEEFDLSPVGLATGYTVKGALLGHITLGISYLEKKSREIKISGEKVMLLQHMLLSHHGIPEWGSPVKPAFLEAFLLNAIDGMDAHSRTYMDTEGPMEPGSISNPVFGLDNARVYKHGMNRNNMEEHKEYI